jgi:hypothetical protein
MLQLTKPLGFIERHGLWTDDRDGKPRSSSAGSRRTSCISCASLGRSARCVARQGGDVPAFLAALTSGYNINVATTTLDSANARTFARSRAAAGWASTR